MATVTAVANKSREELFDDLATFARWHLASWDVDPVYPVLANLWHATEEDRLWFTFVYVAFYNLPSAYEFWPFLMHEMDADWNNIPFVSWCLPTGIERRGLRGGYNMAAHLADVYRIWNDADRHHSHWLGQGFGARILNRWELLQQNLMQVKFNGRWAAYKTGEILSTVHRFPVYPTNMGMAYSSGPRDGLARFFEPVLGNSPRAVYESEVQGMHLLEALREREGLKALTLEQLETVLCDFNSMCKGHYYVGHDIDQLQEQIRKAEERKDIFQELWTVRRAALPTWTLGEVRGWNGVRKELKTVYRDRGVVEWWRVQNPEQGPNA